MELLDPLDRGVERGAARCAQCRALVVAQGAVGVPVHDYHQDTWPEIHVEGEGCRAVEAVPLDTGQPDLGAVERRDVAARRVELGASAERPEGPAAQRRRASSDRCAAIVPRSNECAGDAERLAQIAGQQRDAHEIDPVHALQHSRCEGAAKRSALEGVAVDGERRDKRLETADPREIERAGAHLGEIDLPVPYVRDRPRLVVGVSFPPPVLELDAQRSVGLARHLARELVEVGGFGIGICERQNDGVGVLLTARLVRVVATQAATEHGGGCGKRSENASAGHSLSFSRPGEPRCELGTEHRGGP